MQRKEKTANLYSKILKEERRGNQMWAAREGVEVLERKLGFQEGVMPGHLY